MEDEILKDLISSYEEYKAIKESEERRLYLYFILEGLDEDASRTFLSSTGWIIQRIMEINREDADLDPGERKPILLYINSLGGDLVEGMALISVIEKSKTPVWTINMGQWSSMAFLIGIAGDRRLSLPTAIFLLHDGSFSIDGSTNKVIDKASFFSAYEDKVIRKHVCNNKHSRMKIKDYNKIRQQEYYMTAKEALRWGFIDEIVKSIDDIL